jgi:putative SOS response-associated peptidase YedK
MRTAPEEAARWFGTTSVHAGNAAAEMYPGYPGLVFARGEVRSMVWGFPLALRGKSGQPLKPKPVNNVRSDKLDSFMWRYSFAERRCLIPVTEFAEAEGEKGGRPARGSHCPASRSLPSRASGATPKNGALPTAW